mmetsp:Transcript_11361/g.34205  ORF Transcript_11361/g.34205 Transcript_11361/m.34205 type:complete len:424 (-) Transcript_11361:162-1433(-)|eukprot:CAMPEP_0182917584 /NCGR_PEP_ID=MMETSP0105_2-20130417/1604_1 /TAXON_ID=81532 ORGANISM="Acanthoeca-like sp., Strain 10tr" /NCGR_SAMPLE_ID=MMETSP0105_2 /ASSEMBLY_ACC=CAM_ASM_000205 /LENGTH=423 /DNA_ID=CAMNT_0025054599 /DNA_START=52 /DNA_END=1323 /DNA_ORIENTATION=-
MFRRSCVVAAVVAVAAAQNQMKIQSENNNLAAYTYNDFVVNTVPRFGGTPTMTASIRGIVSSIAANSGAVAQLATQASTSMSNMATSVSSIAASASAANEATTANSLVFGQLSAQVSTQLPFTGTAASQSWVVQSMVSLSVQVSQATAAIASLETHSSTQCETLCGANGQGSCRRSQSNTALFECVCNGGARGPLCAVTTAPTLPPTNRPTNAPTQVGIPSCAQATRSGTYQIRSSAGLFSAYCLVRGGGEPNWMLISAWSGNGYNINTAAVRASACATGNPTGFCKLSDVQINSVITNGARYYYLDTTTSAENMYIYTERQYQDNARSWNAMSATTRGAVRSTWAANLPGTLFSRPWIDFLYVRDGQFNRQETCQRYFVGHGALDCWSGANNFRCIRGGSQCSLVASAYSYVQNWKMYVAAA